jgi:hypothetical protein
MKTLVTLAFVLCLLGSTRVEATSISVDAYLSHPDLSTDNPIDYSVRFPTQFTSINFVELEAYWVGDGLDPGEVIAFSHLAGFGNNGDQALFYRALVFPEGYADVIPQFLDGAFDGGIYGDCKVHRGGPCTEPTTAIFDHLVFTVNGEPGKRPPAPVPEPATLTLIAIGMAPGLLGLHARNRRRRGSRAA